MKGAANHASKAYEFSHFIPFSEPTHSQLPLEREGKNIPSTSFVVSTSIAEPTVLVHEIKIHSDLDSDSDSEDREACAMPCNLTSFREMQQIVCKMSHGKV